MSTEFRNDEYGTEEDFQALTGQAGPEAESNVPAAPGTPSTVDQMIEFEGQKILSHRSNSGKLRILTKLSGKLRIPKRLKSLHDKKRNGKRSIPTMRRRFLTGRS